MLQWRLLKQKMQGLDPVLMIMTILKSTHLPAIGNTDV